jgi:hypothetical protein
MSSSTVVVRQSSSRGSPPALRHTGNSAGCQLDFDVNDRPEGPIALPVIRVSFRKRELFNDSFSTLVKDLALRKRSLASS